MKKSMNNTMIGTPAKATKALKVVAVVLVIYAVLRLMVLTNLFTGFADVVAAVMIALICGYFAGKTRREQHEQEVEDEDEEMLAEAPVLAEPVAPAKPATEPVASAEPATEPEKKFVAPSYKNYQSIVDAQGLADDEKIAIMEQSKIVNEQQQAINDARLKRNQAVADYDATFGRRFATTPAVPTMAQSTPATQTTQSAQSTPATQTTNP